MGPSQRGHIIAQCASGVSCSWIIIVHVRPQRASEASAVSPANLAVRDQRLCRSLSREIDTAHQLEQVGIHNQRHFVLFM